MHGQKVVSGFSIPAHRQPLRHPILQGASMAYPPAKQDSCPPTPCPTVSNKLFHEEHDYKGAEKGRARRKIKILINEDYFFEMKIVILQPVN